MAKILAVDDDPNILEALEDWLGLNGHTVRTCQDAHVALEALADRPDLVISDQQMSSMDGLEFLAAVRKRMPGVPRIMLTGVRDIEVAAKAINDGKVEKFLMKPIDGDALIAAVDEVLGGRSGGVLNF